MSRVIMSRIIMSRIIMSRIIVSRLATLTLRPDRARIHSGSGREGWRACASG